MKSSEITVRFNDVDEFIKELKADKRRIYRRLVRVTTNYETINHTMIYNISVFASYVTNGIIVFLNAKCGEIWRMPDSDTDKATYSRRDSFYRDIEAACAICKLKSTGGVYEFDGHKKQQAVRW
jgi:hypothetical protein